jgi:hypothetical protein
MNLFGLVELLSGCLVPKMKLTQQRRYKIGDDYHER